MFTRGSFEKLQYITFSFFIPLLSFTYKFVVPVMFSSQEMSQGQWLFTVAEPQTSLWAVH